jgi:hypothetical protein
MAEENDALQFAADAAEEFTKQNEYWRRQKKSVALFRAAAAGDTKKIRRYAKPCKNIFVDGNEWWFPPLSTAARIATENGWLYAAELIHSFMLTPNVLVCDEMPLQH